jgi:hypothetical protein
MTSSRKPNVEVRLLDTLKLNAHEVRQVAVAAQVDPRTVERFVAGRAPKQRRMVYERIKRALAELGLGGSNGAPGPAGGTGSGAAGGRRGPRRAPKGDSE